MVSVINPSFQAKIRIVESLCLPLLVYCFPVLRLSWRNQSMVMLINGIFRDCIMKSLWYYKIIHTWTIDSICKLRPLDLNVIKKLSKGFQISQCNWLFKKLSLVDFWYNITGKNTHGYMKRLLKKIFLPFPAMYL